MAKLVHHKSESGESHVLLEAAEGEEVSPVIVLAWATLHQSVALERVANELSTIGDELARIATGLN